MNDYISQLRAEKDNIDATFVHGTRLLTEEIDRSERGLKYTEVHNDKRTKLQERVAIPIKEHPKVNFVGKLLGPAGNTLKQLQQETGTKMSILGRGSMRDRNKEEELRSGGDAKYAHLKDELHVLVEVFAPAVEAHQRMVHALGELKNYLVPEYEDGVVQQQMQELNQMYTNGEETVAPPVRGRGRGGRGMPPPGRGRGVHPPPGGAGSLLGNPPARGAPPARGGPPPRGAVRGIARGAVRGVARGAPVGRGKPEPLMDRSSYAYEEDYSYNAGYDDSYSYGGEQTYRDPYEQTYSGGSASDPQYYEYGHGTGAAREAAYDEYAGESWGQNSQTTYGKAPPPARPKPEYRPHPYGSVGRGAPRY